MPSASPQTSTFSTKEFEPDDLYSVQVGEKLNDTLTDNPETGSGFLPLAEMTVPVVETSDANSQWAGDFSRIQRFKVLRNWEGRVTAVDEDKFWAVIRTVNHHDSLQPEDEIEVDLESVLPGDEELVQEGAIFYLTLGSRIIPGEHPERSTRLIFRRMPRWHPRDPDPQ